MPQSPTPSAPHLDCAPTLFFLGSNAEHERRMWRDGLRSEISGEGAHVFHRAQVTHRRGRFEPQQAQVKGQCGRLRVCGRVGRGGAGVISDAPSGGISNTLTTEGSTPLRLMSSAAMRLPSAMCFTHNSNEVSATRRRPCTFPLSPLSWLTSMSSFAVRISSVSADACTMSVPARSGAAAMHHRAKWVRCSSTLRPALPIWSLRTARGLASAGGRGDWHQLAAEGTGIGWRQRGLASAGGRGD